MMRRSNPFDEIERMFDRMAKQFDDLGHQFENDDGSWSRWGAGTGLSVDVTEYDDEIVVTADLPGFDRSEIDVSATENSLSIGAERDVDAEDEDGEYLRRERRSTSVRRTIALPEPVDEDGAHATYNNGVLTVTLPKHHAEPADEGRHIDVE